MVPIRDQFFKFERKVPFQNLNSDPGIQIQNSQLSLKFQESWSLYGSLLLVVALQKCPYTCYSLWVYAVMTQVNVALMLHAHCKALFKPLYLPPQCCCINLHLGMTFTQFIQEFSTMQETCLLYVPSFLPGMELLSQTGVRTICK